MCVLKVGATKSSLTNSTLFDLFLKITPFPSSKSLDVPTGEVQTWSRPPQPVPNTISKLPCYTVLIEKVDFGSQKCPKQSIKVSLTCVHCASLQLNVNSGSTGCYKFPEV